MSERRSFLADMSWFQVAAGALAAMTSAWIASALGVAGTIIGAALGSLVVAISSSFYASTLDKGRTLIAQTDTGTKIQAVVGADGKPVERADRSDGDSEADGESDEADGADGDDKGSPLQRIRWKVVAVSTVAILAVSLLAIGGYELVTGRAYGSDPDNARIGNPLGGHKSATPSDDSSQGTDDSDDDSDSDDGGQYGDQNNQQNDQDQESDPTPSATQSPTTRTPTPSATSATPSPTTGQQNRQNEQRQQSDGAE